MLPLEEYKEIHANFSGGKDSVAFVLLLIYGYKIPVSKLKLVHMRIDGLDTDSTKTFFDYPETDDYLKYCSEKLDIPLNIIGSEIGLKERILSRGKFPGS
jgi:3'-phosphoadenosine 5'-phosphosulfate sulfotransferase (PAPS reductase)/FAD synthetase